MSELVLYSLLENVDNPQQLRSLDVTQLPQLANELRDFLLHSVAQTGGHLSSNLGTVELSIALHYVFNTPYDRIVWDVGHQTYPHKILTGRRNRMHTLRQLGGLSGFPRRDESEFDTFGTAHSSTSISAALGMALQSFAKGENRNAIAVIGDGAMTAGMAFEAMNNAGVQLHDGGKLLVILNDNDMSISPPVGALNRYLAYLLSGQFYAKAKNVSKTVLRGAPPLFEFAKRLETHAKGMVTPATLFEHFGFNYVGPIDGHDLNTLIPTLKNIQQLLQDTNKPQFLHIVTKKGHGYELAEADPITYHGPGKFDPSVGVQKNEASSKMTFTQVFGQWLCDMAACDERLIGITPAMREGSGMVAFEQQFPKRFFDVGIAEQHAVTFAAGLACEGAKPVVAIYSTFLQRAYDQLIHDVALQNLPVVFALDRAGLVGADGATHAGAYDIAFLRCIPNMALACPADEAECRRLLTSAFEQNRPVAVRYPRGSGIGTIPSKNLESLAFAKGEIRRKSAYFEDFLIKNGINTAQTDDEILQSILPLPAQTTVQNNSLAIFAFGTLLYPALEAAQTLQATVVNMRWVKPLDETLLLAIAKTHAVIVTIEEGSIMGGAGSAVMQCLNDNAVLRPVLTLGLKDIFIEHGDSARLLQLQGLDAQGIVRQVQTFLHLLGH